jgi:hypothetical protein
MPATASPGMTIRKILAFVTAAAEYTTMTNIEHLTDRTDAR